MTCFRREVLRKDSYVDYIGIRSGGMDASRQSMIVSMVVNSGLDRRHSAEVEFPLVFFFGLSVSEITLKQEETHVGYREIN